MQLAKMRSQYDTNYKEFSTRYFTVLEAGLNSARALRAKYYFEDNDKLDSRKSNLPYSYIVQARHVAATSASAKCPSI